MTAIEANVVTAPDAQLLCDTAEQLVRLRADDDVDELVRVWENLTVRQQRIVMTGLAGKVALYEAEGRRLPMVRDWIIKREGI
jgi:hypothetical protein